MKRALLILRYVLTLRNVLVMVGTIALEYVWLSSVTGDLPAFVASATPQVPSPDFLDFVLSVFCAIAAAGGVVWVCAQIPTIVAGIADGVIDRLRPAQERS